LPTAEVVYDCGDRAGIARAKDGKLDVAILDVFLRQSQMVHDLTVGGSVM
jgi:hypothetical protein